MRAIATRFTTLALVALVAAACVSTMVAETPEQRAYAAISEYGIVSEAAAIYAESPAADLRIVVQLVSLDEQGQKVIASIQRIVRREDVPDRERVLSDLMSVLDMFRAAMVSTLVEASL